KEITMQRTFLCVVLILACMPFATAQRLPENAGPVSYKLTFTPDFEKDNFLGDATIDIKVLQPTSEIVLNAAEIEFHDVNVTAGGSTQQAKISTNKENETVALGLEKPIPAGTATIHITYTGILNDALRGFYLGRDEQKRKYAVTQFESTDA